MYIPLIKLQTYTNKLKTYTWNVLPHLRNCQFVQFIDAQAAILLARCPFVQFIDAQAAILLARCPFVQFIDAQAAILLASDR